eukprot:TRINITY_DN770_c0_g3_i1.p1 TRINITY_DN770_c0_g3~~TRINITY_DN770_c0_g3_i1.p1  ORF type:complete len:346 (+),score=122.49 TRINITY_DN770_c0_g3_i1:99-1136(+)
MEKGYEKISKDFVITTYDYAHKIGRGAFADVYRCRKLENGVLKPEIYVAKEIRLQRNIPNMKDLILREINLMFQLTGDQSFVVKIYDYFMGRSPNEMYIIMEYCEGGDLEKYVEENGPLTEDEIADILRPVAEFFSKIHKQGIMHRDLKLANLLLAKRLVKGEKPKIKITDFGLAYVMENEELAHTTCGTPLYMAPEIWKRDKKGYSNKIDVWAFGNMLYKMMYGEYVFEDVNVEKKIKEGTIRFTKLRFASLEAIDLMLKCLRKDPVKRISFDEIAVHPFFTRKEFKIFTKMFDGYYGYIDVNIDNSYDLLKDPNCLKLPEDKPQAFDKHNEEVLKEWSKNLSH